jgi:hypothetical protein
LTFEPPRIAAQASSFACRSVLELFQYIFGLIRFGRVLADYALRAGLLRRRTLAAADFACNNLFS